MKKKILLACILLSFIFTCIPAQARPIANFFQRTRYGQLEPYDNLVFGYGLDVYAGFYMYSEEQLNQFWAGMELSEEDDAIYDIRLWAAPDQAYQLEVQVKEQTYDSLATEIARAPGFLSLIAPEMEAAGYTNLTQLHNGIVRRTPVGDMLEIAYAMTVPMDDNTTADLVRVYYDCYAQGIEFIFSITSYNADYEAAQELLDTMVQTVRLFSAHHIF